MSIRRPVVLAAATGVTLLALTGTALALGGGADDSTRTQTVPTSATSSTGAPPTPLLTDTAQASVGSTTDRAAAEQAAVAHVGNGQVVKVEREFEHGREVWEVDVRTASGVRELHVDTATGQITRDRLDDDDDDRDDRSDDGRDVKNGGATLDDRGGDDRDDDRRGGDDDRRGGDDRDDD